MVKVRNDLTGMTFGMLTVLWQIEDYVDSTGRRYAKYLCECGCENHHRIAVTASNLKQGNVTSCGCVQRNYASSRMKKIAATLNANKHKTNPYDLTGDVGVGWTLNTNQPFYFDLEDYDKIKDYCWHETVGKDGLHRLRSYDRNLKKQVTMHAVLGHANYDHEDRNELNNVKSNLRQCTNTENNYNRSVFSNNTSGCTGVSWNSQNKKWCARICSNGKEMYLGSFINKNDAIKVRLKAEKEICGEFAPQRHLFEEYGIV